MIEIVEKFKTCYHKIYINYRIQINEQTKCNKIKSLQHKQVNLIT